MTGSAGGPGRGFENLRDVGGLPTADGRRVRAGRLYRGDSPVLGDPPPSLRPWPPATVVDLRAPGEADSPTHPLADGQTRVVHVPLLRELNPVEMAERSDIDVVDLRGIYRNVLRAAARPLTEAVGVVACGPGPVLIHCAAGKDRTGIATAITLAAAGVRRPAIVADYVRSAENLDGLLERIALGWSEAKRGQAMHRLTVERPELMLAPAEAIDAVLEALAGWPGGASGWLLDHGLAPEALERLRRELTEPAPAAARPAAGRRPSAG